MGAGRRGHRGAGPARLRARAGVAAARRRSAARSARQEGLAGLRGSGQGARALAAARGLGLQPLAAVRRGSPARAARGDARPDLAPAARRSPQPRAARGRPRVPRSREAGDATRRSARRRRDPRGARDAAQPRGTHPDAGPPLAAPVLSFAAPVRDPERGARDLRRHRCGVPPAAPRRAEPAGDRAAARPLAVADPGARRERPARARALRHHHRRDERAPGRDPAAPPAQPASALARAGALQRPAADARRPAHRQAARLRGQPGAVGRRHAGRVRVLPAEAAVGARARRDQRAVGRGRRSRGRAGGGGAQRVAEPRPAHAALGLQPDGLRRRAGRRVRIRRGQPELRQALRPDRGVRQRRPDRSHDRAAAAAAEAGRVALGVQPRRLGRRPARRLSGAARHRPERDLRHGPS